VCGSRRWLTVAVLVVLLTSHACARRLSEPASRLSDLVRAYDEATTPYYPFSASEMGLHQYDRVLANDISEEYRSGLQGLCTRYLAEARRIDPAAPGEQETVARAIFEHRLRSCVESFRFPWHLLPVNQVGQSWPSRFPVVGAGRGNHPFKTGRHYRDFLGRIDGFVVWMDTAIANMRLGADRGITHPREVMRKILPQLDAQIVDDPTASAFYEPIRNFPASIDEENRRALTASYLEAITHKIVPAYRRLRTFLQDEYLPRCRTSSGFDALPDGRRWYASAVRLSTTTELTAPEIHEIGLAEVQRIRTAMDALRAEIAAAGEPEPARYRSVDDLLKGYGQLRASVEAGLPRLFGRLPRAGFEVRPIEPHREKSMPSSYEAPSLDGARPGVFYLNAGEIHTPSGAPVYRNLFLHEAIPGHHLQIALQRENAALPGFRRFGWYTAYGEGWALYAESLGTELGVYPDRRARLSMLDGELFRARRLVVDTGLHDKGWTREQAIAYLGGRSPNNELEVDRYMVWPGQALAYKIGQLRILQLRRVAEAALGPAFDIRAFHDEVLRDGAMPLDLLTAKMERWIAGQKRTGRTGG
jgi:uncharacterized protein (DUF885 family)